MTYKHQHWVPACGGTEQPFKAMSGHELHYMWCPSTGEHAYYDMSSDLFLSDRDAHLHMWGVVDYEEHYRE
jgi:hypothetical protein